jgi:integral membrane protein
MIKLFKIIALLEGVSLLALFSNMLFIKPTNLELYKSLLFPIGMSHGVLFIVYIVLAILFKFENKYNFKIFSIISLASFIPFGTFYIEKKYLNKL